MEYVLLREPITRQTSFQVLFIDMSKNQHKIIVTKIGIPCFYSLKNQGYR